MGLFRIAHKLRIDLFAAPFAGVSPAGAVAQSLREGSVFLAPEVCILSSPHGRTIPLAKRTTILHRGAPPSPSVVKEPRSGRAGLSGACSPRGRLLIRFPSPQGGDDRGFIAYGRSL